MTNTNTQVTQESLQKAVHSLGVILVINKQDVFAKDAQIPPLQSARHLAIMLSQMKRAITQTRTHLHDMQDQVNPDWISITDAAAEKCDEYLREACDQYRSEIEKASPRYA